ncbi:MULTISPECIES: ThiF family adenylyltransferase [unclassified Mesorhizobium]|uniref:ThiF family adenylyltransferase n=1 Tax=unclassified Mesorhizobium TaxID=325217 RepID=UPI0003CE225D|nr:MULTISPECIES: ThiF family adenylyltransferase [unclassified Mesorhizobium]ESX82759.1 hypothetical protein X755_32875 [Mesorhizobium sp. LNJC405B00]ESY20934.1 hypothetical protein X751_09335 [Mesorhizobium sp. LNJC395A00]WJI74659.1 ThiF family adenylyltransferase [Mesorhizobium sp. C395A]
MSGLALGDRHSRPLDGLGDVASPKTILIRAGDVSGAVNRQHLLVCLVNLLARLHGLVGSIRVAVKGEMTVVTPNGAGPANAFQAVENLASWANGGRIPVLPPDGVEDLTIDMTGQMRGGASIYVWGEGWKAWIGSAPRAFGGSFGRRDCLGPYLAAALAAGEVFKHAKGLKKGRFARDDAYSLWSGESGRWEVLEDGPAVSDTRLPPLYVVGAGAVGQGIIQVLGASELASSFLVTIDHDRHDLEGTNLNRCFLAGLDDLDRPKVEAVERYRTFSGLGGLEHSGTLRDYILSSRSGLHPKLDLAEARDSYELVVSAVDINTSRQDIQGLCPRVVVGGSTDGLRAQAVIYGLVEQAECLGCWNVPDDGRAKAAAREAALRAMSPEERRKELAGQVENLDAALSYLASAEPRCGQLGESDVKSFVDRMPPEFSASFVSMAAATMAAASLFRVTSGLSSDVNLQPKTILQFKNLSMAKTVTARRSGCAHCCVVREAGSPAKLG